MTINILAWLVALPLLSGLTGSRTMTPMAVFCWFAWTGHMDLGDTWAVFTTRGITVIVFTVLAVGELIGDKLPKTPSRLSAFPLIARVCFGGLVGALAATAMHGSAPEGIFLGAISALAGAFVGFNLRRYLVQQKAFPDFAVALFEDAVTIGLSCLAMGFIIA